MLATIQLLSDNLRKLIRELKIDNKHFIEVFKIKEKIQEIENKKKNLNILLNNPGEIVQKSEVIE